MRPAVLALALSGLAALACGSRDVAQCPGNTVAVFRLKGPIVYRGDASLAALDPDVAAELENLPDCTPDPFLPGAIGYPHLLPPFEAKLAADPAGSAAALCRPNGVVYSGARTGATHYAFEADASPAAPCASSVCAATLRVIVAGNVSVDGGGAPQGFDGVLVEVLTQQAGACDGCLPPVPNASPPALACAARYALSGTPR